MTRFTHLRILSLICILLVSVQAGATQKIDDLVVFGDSLSDPGNAFALLGTQSVPPYLLIPEAPYAVGGYYFSNGRTWVERLGQEFGVAVGPAFSSQSKFNNYAIGGARARSYGQIYLSMQIATFLGRNSSKAPASSVYVLFIGSNDVRDAIESFSTDPSGAVAAQIVANALAAVGDNMTALASAGAKQFLVLNVPDLSLVPAVRLQGAQVQRVANYLSNEYNKGLAQIMASLKTSYDVDIKAVDIFALLRDVVANPKQYELSNVLDSCITPGVINNAVCAKPDSYLFWDGIHPTRKIHEVITEAAEALFEKESKQKGSKKEKHVRDADNEQVSDRH